MSTIYPPRRDPAGLFGKCRLICRYGVILKVTELGYMHCTSPRSLGLALWIVRADVAGVSPHLVHRSDLQSVRLLGLALLFTMCLAALGCIWCGGRPGGTLLAGRQAPGSSTTPALRAAAHHSHTHHAAITTPEPTHGPTPCR